MPGGPLRLFVAVPVPPAAVASAVASFGPLLGGAGVRAVHAGSHHVTVRFLGTLTKDDLSGLPPRITAVASAASPTTARLTAIGGFPDDRNARVLWAAVEEDGTLRRLAEALRDLPGDPPTRPFVPHCTLARCEPPIRLPAPLPAVPGEPFRVDAVVLYRSRPGSPHERLEAFPLGR